MSFPLFTSIHNHALSSGYTFGTLIHTSPLTNTPSSPSCIRGLDLINLSFQINNHQTLAICQPRSWNIQPCRTRHVGTGTQSYGSGLRTRFFQGEKFWWTFFFGLLDIFHFFQEDKVGDWKLVKKIYFETQQSPFFCMRNPYPKIPETPLVIHLYVLDSSGFHPAPINLISNSIWPSFDPRHRHRLLLSTRMRWGHHTDQRSQKLPQRHIDPMGLVSCWVSSWDVVFSDSY